MRKRDSRVSARASDANISNDQRSKGTIQVPKAETLINFDLEGATKILDVGSSQHSIDQIKENMDENIESKLKNGTVGDLTEALDGVIAQKKEDAQASKLSGGEVDMLVQEELNRHSSSKPINIQIHETDVATQFQQSPELSKIMSKLDPQEVDTILTTVADQLHQRVMKDI